MDGSVSTLAPLFAAAFATHNTWQTFLVGIAASIGAGISMAFAEALSDDGSLTGRGTPVLRGRCAPMTAAGGLGHTLPYLIPDFFVATFISVGVVAVELTIISFIRHRFMDLPFLAATFQVVVGGVGRRVRVIEFAKADFDMSVAPAKPNCLRTCRRVVASSARINALPLGPITQAHQ